MIRPIAATLLAATALLASPMQARAGESYDNCTGFIDALPAVITGQGTWCLRRDLITAITAGNAIEIAANNVTLDCNGFKLGGLAAGLETLTLGVSSSERANATVKRCNIRGFRIGVVLAGAGGGHLVEGNRLEGNTSYGVIIQGAGSVVRGNRVLNSGGSTISAMAVEAGIEVLGGVDVIDNRVSGVRVFPIQAGDGVISRQAAGIYAVNNDGGSIIGNRISGAEPAGSEKGFGIRILGTTSPTRNTVSGNILMGSGSPAINDTGIACEGASVGEGNTDAISVDNVLIGFDVALDGCSPGENSVNPN